MYFQRRSLISVSAESLPALKPVPSIPGFWAGEDGHVYVQWKNQWWQKKEWPHNGEYRAVAVPVKHGIMRQVQRLICEAFHGPSPEGEYEVSHEDGDPTNNLPNNLKWRTHAGNMRLTVVHGTSPDGVKHPRATFTEEQVRYIRQQRAAGVKLIELQKEFDCASSTISRAANGKRYPRLTKAVV